MCQADCAVVAALIQPRTRATGLPQWVLEMEPCDQRFLRSGAPCWSTQSFQLKYRLLGVTVDPADSLTR